jgi:ABC-type dipeptide/oligopeptide/nickel transport system ATPase subunit
MMNCRFPISHPIVATLVLLWTFIFEGIVAGAAAAVVVVQGPGASQHPVVRYIPQSIEFRHVSHQYPISLTRRLWSSVPLREWALYNLTLTLEPKQLALVTGASSSGKSTLLHLILQQQQPTHGSVTITRHSAVHSQKRRLPAVASTPILLDQKPPFESKQTIESLLNSVCKNKIKKRPYNDDDSSLSSVALWNAVATSLMRIVDLNDDKKVPRMQSQVVPSQLSPSEQYRFEIVRACLQSMSTAALERAGTNATNDANCTKNTNNMNEIDGRCDNDDDVTVEVSVTSPILLLDEWLDKEPTSIVQTVERALLRLLNETGAIVCVVTHKPERWGMVQETTTTTRKHHDHRRLQLCRGQLLLC